MNKKTYEQPVMKVVELESENIIAQSGGYNKGNVKINGGNDLLLDEDDF